MHIETVVAITIGLLVLILMALMVGANLTKPRRDDVLPIVARPEHLPTRAHAADAGMDLRATETVKLAPGQRQLVGTGVKAGIPEGYVGFITPRSGLAHKHGVSIVNAPGTVDAGYTGEIRVNLVNLGREAVVIRKGDRIAQLVLLAFAPMPIRHVTTLADTERGAAGHGSTGAA